MGFDLSFAKPGHAIRLLRSLQECVLLLACHSKRNDLVHHRSLHPACGLLVIGVVGDLDMIIMWLSRRLLSCTIWRAPLVDKTIVGVISKLIEDIFVVLPVVARLNDAVTDVAPVFPGRARTSGNCGLFRRNALIPVNRSFECIA